MDYLKKFEGFFSKSRNLTQDEIDDVLDLIRMYAFNNDLKEFDSDKYIARKDDFQYFQFRKEIGLKRYYIDIYVYAKKIEIHNCFVYTKYDDDTGFLNKEEKFEKLINRIEKHCPTLNAISYRDGEVKIKTK